MRVVLGVFVAAILAVVIVTAIEVGHVDSDVDSLSGSQVNAPAETHPCTRPANQPAKKLRHRLTRPITLTAEPAVGTLNFATSRGTKSLYFVIKASRRLPPAITPAQIELSAPRPPQRSGETLETATLRAPAFSRPRFVNGRKEILFRMCVNASGMKPGSYTSQVFIGGPPGVHGTSVTATITAKSPWFWLGAAAVLVAALILLIVMVGQDMKDARLLLKVVVIGGSLVAAATAMYTVYNADPAWGADVPTSVIALGGTAFGAAGLGTFLTTVFKHGGTVKGKEG